MNREEKDTMQVHSYQHTHADGTTHTHADGTTHSHHDDSHAGEFTTKEELTAMLTYMLDHNRHHAAELHEIGHSMGGDAGQLVHEAMELFRAGNDKLEEALKKYKEA